MAMVETVPWVAVIMGSKSDWEVMRQADETLARFDVPHECRVLSAHRTPAQTAEYMSQAESRGIEVVIAAAGGAAHLAGVCAAHTLLPVLGVPMESASLKGLDSLLSTVQMPAGIPVGTLGIGSAGARNAALLAIAILSASRPASARNKAKRCCAKPCRRWACSGGSVSFSRRAAFSFQQRLSARRSTTGRASILLFTPVARRSQGRRAGGCARQHRVEAK